MQPMGSYNERIPRLPLALICQVSIASALSTLFQLAFIMILSSLLVPYFQFGPTASQEGVGQIVAALLCLALMCVSALFCARQRIELISSVVLGCQEAVFAKLVRLGAIYREDGDMSVPEALMKQGATSIASFYGDFIPNATRLVCTLVALALFAVPKDAAATIILIATPLVAAVAYSLMQRISVQKQRSDYMSGNSVWSSFSSALSGLNTLVLYGADESFAHKLVQESEAAKSSNIKQQQIALMPSVAYIGTLLLGVCVSFIVVLNHVSEGTTNVEGASVLALSLVVILPPNWQFIRSYIYVALKQSYSEKLTAFLSLPEAHVGGSLVPNPGDHFFLKDVSYSYADGTRALDHVSLDIASVGITAIVGQDSAGKSTLARILSGKLRDYSGTILLGGKNLSDFSAKSLHAYVTYVGAKSHHFNKSIRENLHVADPFATDPQLWQVLRALELQQLVQRKGGLDVLLEDAKFSPGELARLALARALLHKSDVYVLDDVSTDLDSHSEHTMYAAIANIARYKAVVVFCAKTSEQAHCIYVLKQGQVVAKGTHDQLLHMSDEYFSLWESEQALDPLRMSAELEEAEHVDA